MHQPDQSMTSGPMSSLVTVASDMFAEVARCGMLHMLSFTEAKAIIQHAAVIQICKVLDMYNAAKCVSTEEVATDRNKPTTLVCVWWS